MKVDCVEMGSPAWTMGVKSHWTICQVNDQWMTPEETQKILDSKKPFTMTFQVIHVLYIKLNLYYLNLFCKSQPLNEQTVMLFRSNISDKKDKKIQMVRKQFPVRLTYAMTINEAQGNVSI